MDTEYAPIDSTQWTLDQPARSTVRGSDREFTHAIGCPRQGSQRDCTCYVSRIRLVETPVGEFIPTTEPDRRSIARFWHEEAERWERQAWIARGLLVAVIIGNLVLGWL